MASLLTCRDCRTQWITPFDGVSAASPCLICAGDVDGQPATKSDLDPAALGTGTLELADRALDLNRVGEGLAASVRLVLAASRGERTLLPPSTRAALEQAISDWTRRRNVDPHSLGSRPPTASPGDINGTQTPPKDAGTSEGSTEWSPPSDVGQRVELMVPVGGRQAGALGDVIGLSEATSLVRFDSAEGKFALHVSEVPTHSLRKRS